MIETISHHFILCGYGRVGSEQISIAPESALMNRSILEASLRRRAGVSGLGIPRERRMEFSPEPTALIRGGDKRVVFCPPESLRRPGREGSA